MKTKKKNTNVISEVRFNSVDDDGKDDVLAIPVGDSPITELEDYSAEIDTAIDIMKRMSYIKNEIKSLEADAEALKLEAIEILAPIYLATGMRGVAGNFGNLTFYYGKTTKFDKKKLRAYLVKRKVKPEVVEEAIKHATSTVDNKNMSIQYDPDNVKDSDTGE